MPSEVAVSAHASGEISQVIMTAYTGLLLCQVFIIACLTHTFAIMDSSRMRTIFDGFSISRSPSHNLTFLLSFLGLLLDRLRLLRMVLLGGSQQNLMVLRLFFGHSWGLCWSVNSVSTDHHATGILGFVNHLIVFLLEPVRIVKWLIIILVLVSLSYMLWNSISVNFEVEYRLNICVAVNFVWLIVDLLILLKRFHFYIFLFLIIQWRIFI